MVKPIIRIYIPTGLPEHLEVIAEYIPEGCEIEWSGFSFGDGHKEGIITLPNGQRYSIDEF